MGGTPEDYVKEGKEIMVTTPYIGVGAAIGCRKLYGPLGAAIGCRFLRNRNQLAFVEYSKGLISMLDLICPVQSVVSQGTAVLKGTWIFDCETGNQGGSLSGPGDIWWEQIDNVKRQMVPAGGASIVNLGKVSFSAVTPAVLQTLKYDRTPIPGNNDATNQLVAGDVFAVLTNAGNFAKILVQQYGYNLNIQWVTYKLASPYHPIGSGYMTPEDIAVTSDEKTAYITERTGDLLRVNLSNANRSATAVVASGMNAPQQIALDEVHHQAYVVEYANPGRLIRIDLNTGVKTVLLNSLNHAIGLLVTPDLTYAYISEEGTRISRYTLANGARMEIATGLVSAFYLTWADATQSSMYVANRDPANYISCVDTVPHPGSVRQVVTGVGGRPSSVALIDSGHMVICCDSEIDCAPLPPVVVDGLFKGIGLVPWNLILTTPGITEGMVDTTTQPAYPYQFPQNSPFGGVLSLQVNHQLARQSGVQFYRILVDNNPRTETWWDLQLDTADGKYDIAAQTSPHDINGQHGYYPIRSASIWYMNTDLGLVMDSTTLANGLRKFVIQFTDAAGNVMESHTQNIRIDNNYCTAVIGMPTVSSQPATPECGILKFTASTNPFQLIYTASQPNLCATYGFWIVKGKNKYYTLSPAPVNLSQITYNDTVGPMLGSCPAAAFSAELAVWASAINGYGRQSQYDAYMTVAFALMS